MVPYRDITGSRYFPLLLCVVCVVLFGYSCTDQPTTPRAPSALSGPSATSDPWNGQGCWPISDICHDTALTQQQVQLIDLNLNTYYHNSTGDPVCDEIIGRAFDRLYSAPSNIRRWTDPPPDYSGDSHRSVDPQVIHMTDWAFTHGGEQLSRSVVHEAAHLLGFNHPSAYLYEDSCM